MHKRRVYAFSGPHKVNFGTLSLGHNRLNRLLPSRYERISSYNAFISLNSSPEIVIVHHSFFWKLWFFIKSIFKHE